MSPLPGAMAIVPGESGKGQRPAGFHTYVIRLIERLTSNGAVGLFVLVVTMSCKIVAANERYANPGMGQRGDWGKRRVGEPV